MSKLKRWMARWLGGANVSIARYLRNVVFAVLFVPVLPDILVDAFGDDQSRWRNPGLRVLALLIIVAGLVSFDRVQRRLAARRASASAGLHRMRHYPVVVVPMGPNQATYRKSSDRRGDPSSTEVIVDKATPSLVIAVTTAAVPDDVLDAVRNGLRADGIGFDCVTLDAPNDAEKAVPDGAAKTIEKLRHHRVDPSDVCCDITGGTKPMSLAMLQAALLYGATCCYVSSEQARGERLPKTQTVAEFSPAAWAVAP